MQKRILVPHVQALELAMHVRIVNIARIVVRTMGHAGLPPY
jgi:hypothetical protein